MMRAMPIHSSTKLAVGLLWIAACSTNPGNAQDADLGIMDAFRRDATRPDSQPDFRLDSGKPDGTVDGEPPDALFPDGYESPDAGPNCGNGEREEDEECDDGNVARLDGCDEVCRFEQVQRLLSLRLQFGTDDFCPNNAFGPAFSLMVRDLIQQSWALDIASGRMSLLIHFIDLPSASGQVSGPVVSGVSWGSPVEDDAYDGLADLDWWYTVDAESLGAGRMPLALLHGGLTDGVLTLGPGTFPLMLNTSATSTGPLALVPLVDARIEATAGEPIKPLSSAGKPPGHLEGERLEADLTAFAKLSEPGIAAARLCGKISAQRLHEAVAPAVLAGTGICRENFDRHTSLLEVLLGGCTNPTVGNLVRATQPDTDSERAAPVGAGPPYTLALDDQGRVDSCLDRDRTSVDVASCLKDAAFSSFFRFSAGRVIAR